MARYEPNDATKVGRPWGWHLCWQAAVGCDFLADRTLAGRLRDRLLDAHRHRGRTLLYLSLLPSEMHVVCRLSPDDEPGAVARAVGSIAARWLRRARTVRSPVFAGPFRAVRQETEADGLRTLRMLCWRPVLQGLCRAPSHHADSSLRATLGLSVARGFDARPLLQRFGDAVIPARAEMRRWLGQRPSAAEFMQWELANGLVLAKAPDPEGGVSSRALRTSESTRLVAASRTKDIAGALQLLELWVTTRIGIAEGSLSRAEGGRRAARGRGLVACLAVAMELCPAVMVASHFRRAKATLSEQMTACRGRAEDLRLLSTPAARIVDEAIGLAAASRQRPVSPGRQGGATEPSQD